MNIRLIPSALRRSASHAVAIAMAAAMTCSMSGQAAGQTYSGQVSPGQMSSGQGFLPPGARIVPASAVETEATVASAGYTSGNRLAPGQLSQALQNSGSIAQVGHCSSCNVPSCNGSCGSYGNCNTGACGPGDGTAGYGNACGIPCDPYQYVIVEGLFLQRQGEGGFSLTRNQSMDEFQFEWAPRITFGSLPNCVNGYEFTWVGPFEFDRRLTVTEPAGNIDSLLFDGDNPVNGGANDFDGTFLDPFQNANVQSQFYNSEYWSAELNKTIVGWDVIRLLLGGKFIRIEEEYGLSSQTNTGSGSLTSSTENSYLGLQAGLDLLYPISRYAYTDLRARGGLYINFVDSDVRLVNGGTTILNARRDDDEIAGVFEFYGGFRYELGEMLSLTAGGEVWYITNAATAVDQISPAVTNALGTRVDIDEDLFYYGAVVGAELRF